MSKGASFRIITADHTGISVSISNVSLAFLGAMFLDSNSLTVRIKRRDAEQITGVKGAELKLAVVKSPSGHKIELLEYLAPADRKKNASLHLRCRPRSRRVHVENLEPLWKIAASGLEGSRQTTNTHRRSNAGSASSMFAIPMAQRSIHASKPSKTATD